MVLKPNIVSDWCRTLVVSRYLLSSLLIYLSSIRKWWLTVHHWLLPGGTDNSLSHTWSCMRVVQACNELRQTWMESGESYKLLVARDVSHMIRSEGTLLTSITLKNCLWIMLTQLNSTTYFTWLDILLLGFFWGFLHCLFCCWVDRYF